MARAMDETWPDLDRLWGDSTMTDAATVQTMFAAAEDAFPAGCSSLAPNLAVSAARRCRMPLTRSATASPDAGADDHVVAIATTSLWDAPCVHWAVAPSVRSISSSGPANRCPGRPEAPPPPATPRVGLVHPVEDPQEGGLATPRRPDQCCHRLRVHLKGNPIQHLVGTEPGRQVDRLERPPPDGRLFDGQRSATRIAGHVVTKVGSAKARPAESVLRPRAPDTGERLERNRLLGSSRTSAVGKSARKFEAVVTLVAGPISAHCSAAMPISTPEGTQRAKSAPSRRKV